MGLFDEFEAPSAESRQAKKRAGLFDEFAEYDVAPLRQPKPRALSQAERGFFADPMNTSLHQRTPSEILSGPTLSAPAQPEGNIANVFRGMAVNTGAGLDKARINSQAWMGDVLDIVAGREKTAAGDALNRNRMREYGQANDRAEAARPEFNLGFTNDLYGATTSLAQSAPSMALAVATKNPALGLGVAGMQSADYLKYRGRGASVGEASLGAAGEGLVEILTEASPMGFLVNKYGTKSAKDFLSGFLIREGLGEQAATLAQDAIDTAVANPDKTWGEYWKERPSAAYHTALGTLMMGGAVAAPKAAAEVFDAKPQAMPSAPQADSPQTAIDAPDATIVNNPSTKPGLFDEFEADVTADPMNPQAKPDAVVEAARPQFGAVVETPGPRAIVERPQPRAIVETPGPRGIVETVPPRGIVEAPVLPPPTIEPAAEPAVQPAVQQPAAEDIELRDLTEGLIRQMRDAKQLDLDHTLRRAIDRIKAGGVNEKPAYFAKLAKEFEKRGDPKTGGMLNAVAATLTKPKAPRPSRLTPIEDGRLTQTDYSDNLPRYVEGAGWAEVGGRLIRGADGEAAGRTAWVPKADWWIGKPEGVTEAILKSAAPKALAGQPMTAAEKNSVKWLLDVMEKDLTAEISPEGSAIAEDLANDPDIDLEGVRITDPVEQMRSMGFTEDEINAEQGRTQAAGETAEGRAAEGDRAGEGQAPQEGAGGQEARPDLSLTQQTERDLAERERELNRREAEQNARERAALDKEKADRARDDFTLTGSDRAADANAGQGDLLARNDEARDDSASPQQKAQDDAADTMFSRTTDTRATYDQRIDELFDGKPANRVGAMVLDRSDVLDMLGMGDKPVRIAEHKVIASGTNHGLTAEHWKKIPEWLDSPAAVFDSDTVPGRLVFVAPEQVNGNPVVMVVEPDAEVGETRVNLLVNAYDKSGGRMPVRRWVEDGLTRYIDKSKSRQLLATSGLQLPGVLQKAIGSKRKIYTDADLVKYRQSGVGTRFARGRAEAARDTGPVSQVELDAVIERVASGWERAQGDGGRLIAVDTVADLPVAILRAADAQNVPQQEIKGVFHKGHIYLVRENHASAQAVEETIFHEAYGHMGALLLNGNDRQKLSATFNDVWRRIDGLDGVRKMADKFGVLDQVEPYIKSLSTAKDMTLETKRRIIVDELLAHVAGRGDFTLKEQAQAYIGAMRVGLRNAARAMKLDGIAQTLDGYTDSELLWNLKQMRAAVVSGKTGKGGGALFARRVPAGPNSPQQSIRMQNRPGFTVDPETRAEGIQRRHQDKMNRWAKVQRQIKEQGGTVELDQDVYHAMERMTGRAADRIDQFTHETVRPLLKRIADLNTNFEELGTYLMALGAKDRNDYIQTIRQDMPDNGSGLSNQEAAQIIADYRKRPDFAKFDALARDFQKLTERKLKVLVGGGVISQQQATDMTQAFGFYVPFKGFEKIDEDGNRAGGTGAGYSTPKRFTKQAFGRVSKAGQVVENIIRDYEQAVILAEKANVGRYVRNLAQANPDPTLWTVDQPPSQPSLVNGHVQMRQATFDNENEIRFIEGGKEVRIQLHDPLLAQTYNNLGQEPLHFLMKAGDTLNRFLRQTYTQKNPAFILVNGVRDVQTGLALMTAEMGATAAAKAMRHMAGAWKASSREAKKRGSVTGEWAKYMDAYRKSGAQTAYYAIEDIEAKQTKLHELMAREGGGGLLWAWKQHGVKGLGKMALYRSYNNAVVDVIESLNSGFENMMRLAAFRQYIDDHGGIDSPSRETLAEASRIAKNLTVNFNRKGEKTRGLNALYLFWNANVQGTQNLYRAAMSSAHKGQVRAAIGGMVGLGFLMAMATDEDDDELTPGYLKDTSIVIHAGDGKRIQIPLAYGLGAFVAMGYEVGMLTKGARTPIRSAVNLLATTLQHFSPLGNPIHDGDVDSKDLAVMAMPTILKVPTMIATNRNSFGYDVVPKFDDEQPDRPAMRNATRGGVFDKAAGGLEYVGLDVSPESLKLTSNFLTGGLGTFLSDSATALMSGSKGQFEAEKVPILKRFYGENDVEEYRSRFYEQANDVKQQASAQGKKQKEFFGSDKARDSVMDYTKQMKELREKESAAYKADKFKTAERLQTQQIKLSDAFKREHDRMVRRGLIER